MAEQKLNVLLDKLVRVKISFENIEQNKTNKFWCDQHQYNPFHETKDCNFLNNKKKEKSTNIKQAEVTDDCSDDEFHSADDSSET